MPPTLRASLVTLVGAVSLTALLTGAGSAHAAASPAATPAVSQPGHVFLIEIENESYDSAYVSNPNPYLSRTLPMQGQLLTQYYGVGHESNDNYLAELSGQAPNPATQADCQAYTDFEPSPAVLDANGQAVGAGCVFPANVKTLPDQLTATGHTWKAYMQDMGNDKTREADRCGTPGSSSGVGSRDGTQKATATDQYAARHNPFVYFHSIVDSGACQTNVVPLTELADDLAHPADFTWITPNLCSDGHDDPCTGKNEAGTTAGGLKAVDLFLAKYVPMIEASPVFQKDGVLIITSDESDTGDTSSCCREQPGPNSPLPGITGAGGGRVGTLVIGHCVPAGTKNATPYNHYALLRSLEDAFAIRTGGSDGRGHLGYAGAAGLKAFGTDVYGGCNAGAGGGAGGGPSPVTSGGSGEPEVGSSASATGSSGALAFTGGLPLAPVGVGLLAAAGVAAYVRRTR